MDEQFSWLHRYRDRNENLQEMTELKDAGARAPTRIADRGRQPKESTCHVQEHAYILCIVHIRGALSLRPGLPCL